MRANLRQTHRTRVFRPYFRHVAALSNQITPEVAPWLHGSWRTAAWNKPAIKHVRIWPIRLTAFASTYLIIFLVVGQWRGRGTYPQLLCCRRRFLETSIVDLLRHLKTRNLSIIQHFFAQSRSSANLGTLFWLAVYSLEQNF